MSPSATHAAPPAQRGFAATASRTADVALVAFRGELDLPAAARAGSALERLLRGGAREVLVDFSGVTFLDCAGLGTLIEVACAANLLGARVYIFRAEGQPRELLDWARPRCGLPGF